MARALGQGDVEPRHRRHSSPGDARFARLGVDDRAPPAEWTGETGFVRAELLARHLPAGYRRFQFFICGPAPMMDATERALSELGVPEARIHTERFDMV